MTMRKAVAGILIHEDKVLIGKKIKKEGHFVSGCWHIPGGHVFDNEDDITALLREFKEETNLDIEIIRKITSIEIPKNEVIVHWYLCKTNSKDFVPGDDLSEIKLVDKKDVIEQCDKRATALWPKEVLEYLKKH